MNIITISREFGSGGRELGKRLADVLGYAYYDREILTEIANKANVEEGFVENVLNKSYTVNYAFSFRNTFTRLSPMSHQAMDLFKKQTEVLQMIAETRRGLYNRRSWCRCGTCKIYSVQTFCLCGYAFKNRALQGKSRQ